MEKEAAGGLGIQREPNLAVSAGIEKHNTPPLEKKDWTPEERKAARVFINAVIEDVVEYMSMEEDVEEEYRRAGKLHIYNPDTEWQKRYARVARKFPPPDGFDPELEEYFKLIDDDDKLGGPKL